MPALHYVSFFTLLTTALAVAAVAPAQTHFPSKPDRIVTGGAGSQTDIMTRLVGQKLSERWGQPVVIENRTGAGGAMAASVVAKAVPDGQGPSAELRIHSFRDDAGGVRQDRSRRHRELHQSREGRRPAQMTHGLCTHPSSSATTVT